MNTPFLPPTIRCTGLACRLSDPQHAPSPGQVDSPDTARRRLCLSSLALWAGGSAGAFAKTASREQPLAIPLAQDAPDLFDPSGYLVSEKYDGVRAVWNGRELRFRSGRPIAAPAWFLSRLPPTSLDGELWLGRGQFEALSGAARRLEPLDAEWRAIRYCVFDLPQGQGGFAARSAQLAREVRAWGSAAVLTVQQDRVPSHERLLRRLAEVVQAGGEGLVLRAADAPYRAGRSADMLKLKPLTDAEATVLAHEPGKGRFAGQLGALHVRTDAGVAFKIGTGFNDAQRARPPAVGERISFTYRGLTEEGVPRFASFLRVRPGGI